MDMPLRQELDGRLAELKNEYEEVRLIHKDIRDNISPRTAVFDDELTSLQNKRQDLKIVNNTATLDSKMCANGMMSGMTNPRMPWMKIETADPDLLDYDPVKEWLYAIEKGMYSIFSRSNLYHILPTIYRNAGDYGNGFMFELEDDANVARFLSAPIGSTYIAQNGNGLVRTIYRVFSETVNNAVQMFGIDRVSTMVRNMFNNNNRNFRITLVHAVEERVGGMPGAFARYKPVRSVYYELNTKEGIGILREGGYDDFPAFGLRWDQIGTNPWGIGIGESTLGDTKQLQLLERRKLQALDKLVDPDYAADASLRNNRNKFTGGTTTYVPGMMAGTRPGVAPIYEINPRTGEVSLEIQRVESRIDAAYFKSLFLVVQSLQMDSGRTPTLTATHIQALKEEKLLQLGPVLERVKTELLDPLIDRTFTLMLQRNLVPPPPKELQGMPLKVEYTSVFAQAQKAVGLSSIDRYVGTALQWAQVWPQALAKVNINEALNEVANQAGTPPRVVVPDDQAAAAVAQQQQQQQMAQMTQMAAEGAGAMKDAAQADLGTDNAMSRIISGIQSAQQQ